MTFVSVEPGVLASVSRTVTSCFLDIGIDDDGAVEGYLDVVSFDIHFLFIPFSQRTQETSFGRNDSINGPMILPRLKFGIYRGGIVQNLQLFAFIGGISGQGGMYTKTIIRTRC